MPLKPTRSAWAALPREARDTLFMLLMIGWVVGLQVPHLPWCCSALALGVLVWRGWQVWHGHALPRWPWKVALTGAALLATWQTHGTVIGQEAGLTLIVVLLALKTLELRARRDAYVVFFIGFFTLLTQFFHSQSLLTALAILIGVLGLMTGLVNAHMPVGRPPLTQAARQAGLLLLWSLPLTAILFVFFPRLSPFWGIPNADIAGRSGLSGEMEVGKIARLALDERVAMRVEFLTPPPALADMYFRGPVLVDFDGSTWRARPPGTDWPSLQQIAIAPEAVRYRITLEPSNRPWLPTLDISPQGPRWAGGTAVRGPDIQWLAPRPVTELLRYEAESYTLYRFGPSTRHMALERDLALPPGFNPRTLQWAQDLKRRLGHDVDPRVYVNEVLQQLREGGYRYTLEPGVFGRHAVDEFWFDRKVGFCEHIASSFVVMMRALDTPARVVTGYQGGEVNPIDGFWTVRQSDAHAWAEVWLPGLGWQRIDPTSAVAPDRTQSTQRLQLPEGALANALNQLNPAMLEQLRTVWDAVNNRWNQWVLNYSQAGQLALLQNLGFEEPDWLDLFQLLAWALIAVAAGGTLIALWPRRHPDPWHRLFDSTRSKLRQAGCEAGSSATPRQLMAALEFHDTQKKYSELHDALHQLEQQRYDPESAINLAQLRQAMKRMPWPRRNEWKP